MSNSQNEIQMLTKQKNELDLQMAHEEEKAKREFEIEEKIKYQRAVIFELFILIYQLLEEEDSRIHNIIAAVKAAWAEFKGILRKFILIFLASKTKKKKKGGKKK